MILKVTYILIYSVPDDIERNALNIFIFYVIDIGGIRAGVLPDDK